MSCVKLVVTLWKKIYPIWLRFMQWVKFQAFQINCFGIVMPKWYLQELLSISVEAHANKNTTLKKMNLNLFHHQISYSENLDLILLKIVKMFQIMVLELNLDNTLSNLNHNMKLCKFIVIMKPKEEGGLLDIPTLKQPIQFLNMMMFLLNYLINLQISILKIQNSKKVKLKKSDSSVWQIRLMKDQVTNISAQKIKI